LNHACSSPIARILPPESTSWPRAGIGILKPGLLVVEATDVIFGLLSPEPYLVITPPTKLDNPATAAVVTEMLTTALLH
jgi:hypothetical protein